MDVARAAPASAARVASNMPATALVSKRTVVDLLHP